ncbi:tyrosine-type recombinase/integrase [Streptomyces sp. NPDC054854]
MGADRLVHVRCTHHSRHPRAPVGRAEFPWGASATCSAPCIAGRTGPHWQRFALLVPPWTPQTAPTSFRPAFHDLRHLAATITVTASVPLPVVSKTLRHSTLSTTANIYSHLTQQAAREPSKPSTTLSPEPRNETTDGPGWTDCDHHATTSSTSAKPSTGSAPPPRPASTPPPTNPKAGMRPHCDHQHSGHGKGRPLTALRSRELIDSTMFVE